MGMARRREGLTNVELCFGTGVPARRLPAGWAEAGRASEGLWELGRIHLTTPKPDSDRLTATRHRSTHFSADIASQTTELRIAT